MSEWKEIETLPVEPWRLPPDTKIVIACFHQPRDEYNEPLGKPFCLWSHVVCPHLKSWGVLSNGLTGFSGGSVIMVAHADKASHWMPLPPPPQATP